MHADARTRNCPLELGAGLPRPGLETRRLGLGRLCDSEQGSPPRAGLCLPFDVCARGGRGAIKRASERARARVSESESESGSACASKTEHSGDAPRAP